MAKNIEETLKKTIRNFVSEEQLFKDLAQKYNMKVTETGVDLGCPWVVNPLEQTEEIKFAWSLPFWGTKEDKHERFKQGLNALKTADLFISSDIEQGFININIDQSKMAYVQLSVYGRIMLFNIVKNQDSALAASIIEIILPFASEGLDMNGIDFIKAKNVTIGTLFNMFIKPELDVYNSEDKDKLISSSNNNSNDIIAIEEKEVKLDKRVITESEKKILEDGIKYLESIDLLSNKCAKELEKFSDSKGCEINNDFLKGLVDIYSDSPGDQEIFNYGLAGLTVLLPTD